jgi:hypothetical protein
MSKGWNTFGALLLAAGFFICLMWSSMNVSLHGGFSMSYGGTIHGGVITFLAVMIAWFGVRDGQRWAWWSLLLALLTVAVIRIGVDRSCTVGVFWQHGCHQFMIGLLLGVIGLVLTRD